MTTSPGLYRLLTWLSPNFPTGAFSYSHGLEAAHAAGAVGDRTSLQAWVKAIVIHGSGRMDADILRAAYRAAAADDQAGLAAANQRGVAYRPTAELALESAQQGAAFRKTWRNAWTSPSPALREREGPAPKAWEGEGLTTESGIRALTPTLSPGGGEGAEVRAALAEAFADQAVCHPAAFGAAAAAAGIALDDAVLGYLHAFAANLVSAGLRLGIIGQTDGQRILAALEPLIAEAAINAMSRDPDDFGSATFAVDLASMAHETQYSRLFRS